MSNNIPTFAIARNQLLFKDVKNWDPEFEVSTYLRFSNFDSSDWFNVFHVTAVTNVWTHKGKPNSILVATTIDERGKRYKIIRNIHENKWINLTIRQYKTEVRLDQC